AHLLRCHLIAETALGQAGDQLRRRRRAEIGGDQQLLEFLQRRVVEAALGEDAGDAVADPARRAGQPLAQPRQPAALRGLGGVVAHAAQLAESGCATSPSASAPVTRAGTMSPGTMFSAAMFPGAAAPASATGAKCGLWPRAIPASAVSTSTS